MRGTPAKQASQSAPSMLPDRGTALRVTEVVRTDSQSQTLDSFLERPSGTGAGGPAVAASFMAVPRKRRAAEHAVLSQGVCADTAEQEPACAADDEPPAHPAKRPRSALPAVAALQAEVEGSTDQGAGPCLFHVMCLAACTCLLCLRGCCQHAGLRNKLRKLVYVGAVTPSHILVQEDTSLLLLDMGKLSKDLFYQKVCTDGCMRRLLQGSC